MLIYILVCDYAAYKAAKQVAAKFIPAKIDASSAANIVEVAKEHGATHILNAVEPKFVPTVFSGAFSAEANYLDMAMNLSEPHPTNPYEEIGVTLGHAQLAAHEEWKERGLLALVGMGVEPGLSDIFARYAADHLFDEVHEIGVRDGSNLSIDGYDFAPTFSIWTTIEECLNPPLVWEKDRGLYTTDCFSEPEVFHFPAGIGPVECVNVEHEEVLLIPREVDCSRVTFKYGLGAEFIDWLKTFQPCLDGLHRTASRMCCRCRTCGVGVIVFTQERWL